MLRSYIDEYLAQAQEIIKRLDRKPIEGMIDILLKNGDTEFDIESDGLIAQLANCGSCSAQKHSFE